MAFEPASLQSRLADMCREFGCPPGRDLVQWLRENIILYHRAIVQLETALIGPTKGQLFADGPEFTINTELGIEIEFEGYNGKDEAVGKGIIYIEDYKGEIILRVWADINDEEPTHKISLEGARESNRKESSND